MNNTQLHADELFTRTPRYMDYAMYELTLLEQAVTRQILAAYKTKDGYACIDQTSAAASIGIAKRQTIGLAISRLKKKGVLAPAGRVKADKRRERLAINFNYFREALERRRLKEGQETIAFVKATGIAKAPPLLRTTYKIRNSRVADRPEMCNSRIADLARCATLEGHERDFPTEFEESDRKKDRAEPNLRSSTGDSPTHHHRTPATIGSSGFANSVAPAQNRGAVSEPTEGTSEPRSDVQAASDPRRPADGLRVAAERQKRQQAFIALRRRLKDPSVDEYEAPAPNVAGQVRDWCEAHADGLGNRSASQVAEDMIEVINNKPGNWSFWQRIGALALQSFAKKRGDKQGFGWLFRLNRGGHLHLQDLLCSGEWHAAKTLKSVDDASKLLAPVLKPVAPVDVMIPRGSAAPPIEIESGMDMLYPERVELRNASRAAAVASQRATGASIEIDDAALEAILNQLD